MVNNIQDAIGNVSINLSFVEFRDVIEKIQAAALDIQEHEYPSDIRIEKLSKIHEYTAYLLSMANTKEPADSMDGSMITNIQVMESK